MRAPLRVCATPIGNLADVTLRVLDELRAADLVLCEDTRRTRTLLARHGIDRPLSRLDAHTEAGRAAGVVGRLEGGERVVLVSDAGLPGVNDPGARLIRAVLAAGLEVSVVPGPSAVETALVASGLVGERYTFVGYLPRRPSDLESLWAELLPWSWPVVAFESPQRLPRSLASLAAAEPGRQAAVCRELTKRFEQIARGSAAELAAQFEAPPKGEVTLVIAGSEGRPRPAVDDRGLSALVELVARGIPRREAARIVGSVTGMPANELYRASLDRPAEGS